MGTVDHCGRLGGVVELGEMMWNVVWKNSFIKKGCFLTYCICKCNWN